MNDYQQLDFLIAMGQEFCTVLSPIVRSETSFLKIATKSFLSDTGGILEPELLTDSER